MVPEEISNEEIKNSIYTTRGKQVLPDSDVAMPYHYETKVISPLGHDYKASIIEPTCLEQGYTIHTCLSCGNEYKDNIVPATGHDYETEVVREPHCKTEGERKFHCKKCEKEYYAEIPAAGHDYELSVTEEANGENIRTYVCTHCGETLLQNMGEQYEQVSSYTGYLFK